ERVQVRLLPWVKSYNPRCPAGGRVAMPRRGRSRGRLELSLLSLCDRGKVIVAVDGLLAHVLAAVEQEEGERYSDHRSEEGAKLPVGCPVVGHQEPPIIRTHGANACLGSRFLRRTDARGTAADLWRAGAAFNEGCAGGLCAPSPRYRVE